MIFMFSQVYYVAVIESQSLFEVPHQWLTDKEEHFD